MECALVLLAGKGSVANLVSDPEFGDVQTKAVSAAQRRFVVLLLATVVVCTAIAVATA